MQTITFVLPEGRQKEIDPPAAEFYATDVFNEYCLEFIKKGQATKNHGCLSWTFISTFPNSGS